MIQDILLKITPFPIGNKVLFPVTGIFTSFPLGNEVIRNSMLSSPRLFRYLHLGEKGACLNGAFTPRADHRNTGEV
jgi:hypothetical protein